MEWFESGAVTDDMRQNRCSQHYVAKNVFGPTRENAASLPIWAPTLFTALPIASPAAVARSQFRSLQDHQFCEG